MPLNFNKHAAKGNQFLKELALELGNKADIKRAGRVLRAMCITLRRHLTQEENFQVIAQLPMALKSVYVDGWSPFKKDRFVSRRSDDFILEFVRNEGTNKWQKFSECEEGAKVLKIALNVLKKHISSGEFRDMEAVLPKALKKLIHDS